jgi:hypothetical protein
MGKERRTRGTEFLSLTVTADCNFTKGSIYQTTRHPCSKLCVCVRWEEKRRSSKGGFRGLILYSDRQRTNGRQERGAYTTRECDSVCVCVCVSQSEDGRKERKKGPSSLRTTLTPPLSPSVFFFFHSLRCVTHVAVGVWCGMSPTWMGGCKSTYSHRRQEMALFLSDLRSYLLLLFLCSVRAFVSSHNLTRLYGESRASQRRPCTAQPFA